MGNGVDVVDAGCEAAIEGSATLCTEHEILRGAGSGAVTDEVLNHLHRRLDRTRRPDELYSVLNDVVGHGNAAHEFLILDDRIRSHDFFDLALRAAGGCSHNVYFLLV